MSRFYWTEKHVSQAKKILPKHATMDEALEAISQHFGRPVTRGGLDTAFKRFEEPQTPYEMLAPPPLDPVARREKVDAHARLRTEINGLVDELREYRRRQEFIEALTRIRPPPRILRHEKNSGKREMCFVALASDWHVEERVDPEAINGVNEYDMEIAKHRVKRFFDSIVSMVRHHMASGLIMIRQLLLWLGGDFITGFIHEECVENNELAPTLAIMWLMPLLRDGILMLLQELDLDEILIPCSFGNHGRTTMKPRIVTGYANSFEWLMYCQLRELLKDEKRVRFEITASAHQYVDVFDFRLHFHHGDDFKFLGGIGGLAVPLLRRVAAWNQGPQRAHVHNIGHWHQKLDLGKVVVNGSLIGYGAYSQRIGASPEDPQQAFYLVDSKRGKCNPGELWVAEHERPEAA